MRKKAHKLLFKELFYQTTERRASRESIQKLPSPPPTPTLESDRINDKSFWACFKYYRETHKNGEGETIPMTNSAYKCQKDPRRVYL